MAVEADKQTRNVATRSSIRTVFTFYRHPSCALSPCTAGRPDQHIEQIGASPGLLITFCDDDQQASIDTSRKEGKRRRATRGLTRSHSQAPPVHHLPVLRAAVPLHHRSCGCLNRSRPRLSNILCAAGVGKRMSCPTLHTHEPRTAGPTCEDTW